MRDYVKLPRKLSEEPHAPWPLRASHARVIEHLDRWANSPGLQPPQAKPPQSDDARSKDRKAPAVEDADES